MSCCVILTLVKKAKKSSFLRIHFSLCGTSFIRQIASRTSGACRPKIKIRIIKNEESVGKSEANLSIDSSSFVAGFRLDDAKFAHWIGLGRVVVFGGYGLADFVRR